MNVFHRHVIEMVPSMVVLFATFSIVVLMYARKDHYAHHGHVMANTH